jgi:ketosteroid isomerase-like protein
MSEENVEVIRAVWEAWNAGDMDAVRELHDPDVILRTVEDWPEQGPYLDREAVMRFYEQLRDTWDTDTLEATSEFLHAADRVVVRYALHGVGHGPQTDLEYTVVYSVRRGKIREVEYFRGHAEALEAAGLEE